MKDRTLADSERDANKLESKPETYSLKSLDSQLFETPAVCH